MIETFPMMLFARNIQQSHGGNKRFVHPGTDEQRGEHLSLIKGWAGIINEITSQDDNEGRHERCAY